MEDERKQRLYAEEVAAARLRRESTRAGGVPSASPGFLPPSSSSSSLHSERNRPQEPRRYSRPSYDPPRREGSDSGFLAISTARSPTHSNSPHSSPSPGSSRPPSIIGQSPATSSSNRNSIQVHSRPPSVYSTHTLSSSEDVRNNGKRNSSASVNSFRPNMDPRASMWGGSNHNLQVPPVPAMPAAFVMDMPLLPPTPPFMMHQYPRQRSPSNSRQKLPSSSSSDRMSQQSPYRHSPPPHPPSPASANGRPEYRPTHSRKSSNDTTRRASMPVPQDRGRPQPPSSHSQPHLSTSGQVRPTMPSSSYSHSSAGGAVGGGLQHLHPAPGPSPWTALPSQSGRLPVAMPVNPYSHHTGSSSRGGEGGSRRQTIIL